MPVVERVRILAEGFAGLRDGAKYMLFGVLFEAVGIMMLAPALFGGELTAASGSIASIILVIIGALASVFGLIKWKKSGELFKQFDPDLRYAESGPKYMLYAIPLAIIALLIMLGSLSGEAMGILVVGYLLLLIAGLLVLVGYILFGIFLVRVSEIGMEGVTLPNFKIDGVLWIVGIIFGILALVAVILIYMHSKEAEAALRTYRPPPQPEQPLL
ncbi:MAG: DUF973 family protein [Desulfurococcales archaeon]|nr:DUF973 family protein [Desulfurococcales archaeon]